MSVKDVVGMKSNLRRVLVLSLNNQQVDIENLCLQTNQYLWSKNIISLKFKNHWTFNLSIKQFLFFLNKYLPL